MINRSFFFDSERKVSNIRQLLACSLMVACLNCSDKSGEESDNKENTEASSGSNHAGVGGNTSLDGDGGKGSDLGGAGGNAIGSDSGGNADHSGGTSADGGTGSSDSGGTASSDSGGTAGSASGGSASGGSASGGSASGGSASGGSASGGGGDVPPDGISIDGDNCQFVIDHTQSTAISTVTIVNWSFDLNSVTDAHIDFGPVGSGLTMSAPVDLSKQYFRTLLLGMKTDSEYQFRITANSGSTMCTSSALTLTTGPRPEYVRLIEKTVEQTGGAEGFYLTTPGVVGDLGLSRLPGAYIFDSDGDVVWWAPEAEESGIGGAQISWDGQSVWHVSDQQNALYRTSIDGLENEVILVGHHDLTPLPGGGVATFDGRRALVEVKDDGTITDIALLEDLYEPVDNFHANAVVYHPADDSFTISDLYLDGFVKVSRSGQLLWQLGGENPKGNFFELIGIEPWNANHGHHLGPDGQFLFYNNLGTNGFPDAIELLLDEDNWTATKIWDYNISGNAQWLGNVQRLESGNTLIGHSAAGSIFEISPSGDIIQSFGPDSDSGSFFDFGYVRFRKSLYGPPMNTWTN